MRSLALALVLVVPATAVADRREITVGVSVGRSADDDAADDAPSTRMIGLWGRLRFSPRVAGQLELQRHTTEGCGSCTVGTTNEVKSATALLVVDLADGGRWMPMLVAGIGLDRDDTPLETEGHHIEGGFALEYRSADGFTFGGDVRLGGRSIDSQEDVIFLEPIRDPGGMQAGEYRSARINLGLRF